MNIFLCGDVMTGRGIDQILKHPLPPQLYEGYVKDAREYVKLAERINGQVPRYVNDDYIWGDALKIWEEKNTDIKIINLETDITTSSTYVPKGINYRMHPDNASVLQRAGVDVCVLANNHVLDWDHQGLKDTLKRLDELQIKHAGAGKTRYEAQLPAVINHREGRVLIFSICLPSSGVPVEWEATKACPGVFLLNDLSHKCVQEVKNVIERHRQEGDLVILSVHWGSNWGHDISDRQKDFAHALIDECNVDIIHGHSSHHPRAMEMYKERLVFYGCGDFINDYEGITGYEEYRDDLTLMYFVDCEVGPFKLKNLSMHCLVRERFQLKEAKSEDVKWMEEILNDIGQEFHTSFSVSGKNEIALQL